MAPRAQEQVLERFRACKTGDGLLSRAQLSALCRGLGCGFTEEDVGAMLHASGAGAGDAVRVEDFLAWLFEEDEGGSVGLERFTGLEGGPLLGALQSGSVRLARGAYFERALAAGEPLRPRQQMVEEDLWPPEEAARMWLEYRNLFLLVVSYGWLAREHPDPEMWHLRRLVRILREWRAYLAAAARGEVLQIDVPYSLDSLRGNGPSDVGVFLDFVSFYQAPRTPEQQASFDAGLGEINTLYAHEFSTTLCCTAVPDEEPRKYHNRGWTLFESCVTAAKPGGFMKIFDFNAALPPQLTGHKFLLHHMQRRRPPCSHERFEELMEERRRVVASLPHPHNRLFTNNKDQPRLHQKYEELWNTLRRADYLEFPCCGWGPDELRELLQVMPCFKCLRCLNLNSNKLGDAGAELLVESLPSGLEGLYVWNNQISEAGAWCLLRGVPASLRYLNLSRNPVCREPATVEQLQEIWCCTGRDAEGLCFE